MAPNATSYIIDDTELEYLGAKATWWIDRLYLWIGQLIGKVRKTTAEHESDIGGA